MTFLRPLTRESILGPWPVEADQSLLDFLRGRIGWTADTIIESGLVFVQHRVWPLPNIENPKAGSFRLVKGDQVIQGVPLPTSVTNRLELRANLAARDFMFAPGLTDFERRMADFLLAANPRLQKIEADDLMTFLIKLKEFRDQPIGTIHIVAHGWVMGRIYVPLRPPRPGNTEDDIISYEGLEEAVADRSLVVDPSLFQPPRPLDPDTKKPIPGTVRIWACMAGLHRPFVEKLHEALGSAISTVSAPRYLQGAGELGSGGRVAYLRQDFMVFSPKPLDRPGVIRQFQAGDLPYTSGPTSFFDGRPVPAREWSRWLPQQINTTEGAYVRTLRIDARVAEPRGSARIPLDVYYYWKKNTADLLLWNMESVKPRDEKDALAKLPAFVAKQAPLSRFNDKHPFPLSMRGGYKNFADFVNGFKWDVTKVSDFTYSFTGTRWEYSLWVPIRDGEDLICNTISGDKPPQMARQFRDDDPRFFTTVGSN